MLDNKPNSDITSDDNVKNVAKALGVDLDNNDEGTEEKESNSSKKTDTETTEDNRSGKSDKPSDDVDYKKKYSESTKEFQEKYKPLEDSIKKLEQISGKSLNDILVDYTKSSEEQIESKKKEEAKKGSNIDDEVNEKLSSVEKKLSSLEEKVSEQDERNRLSAKEKVQVFQDKYEISDEDYSRKYQPLLSGIKEMKKENGDPYTLEEALDLSYLIGNKNTIDKVVEQKMKVRQHEQELSFSPSGSKKISSTNKKPVYSELQQEAARKMGISLEEESK